MLTQSPTGTNMRIILVRHGQPHIALSPRTTHRGFGDYIGAYEAAGLDPASLPPSIGARDESDEPAAEEAKPRRRARRPRSSGGDDETVEAFG
jgi:hypothetical protein